MSGPITDAEEIAVAAPPWAATALDAIAASGGPGPRIRHVVVDPRKAEKPHIPGVRVLWRFHLNPAQLAEVVECLPDLEWVHSDYVGVDDLPLELLSRRGITLSNGAGISAGPMAEWVVLSLLSAAKQLPRFLRQSDAHTWEVGELLGEMRGSVVVLLGLGAIATRVAELLAPFGADVCACTRKGRTELPAGVTRSVSGEAWRAVLPEADFVVCTVPLTTATKSMIDSSALASMKREAWLVNVSRGAVVDEAALVDALDREVIGGAVLDAFSQEPLPPEHPLWGRPNVLVLPHVTWSSSHTLDDFTWRFAEQIRRFAGGQAPADQIDHDAGY